MIKRREVASMERSRKTTEQLVNGDVLIVDDQPFTVTKTEDCTICYGVTIWSYEGIGPDDYPNVETTCESRNQEWEVIK